MRAVDAVFNSPTQVPRVRRGVFGAVTFAAWTAFLWLLAPLGTLLLWAVGVSTAYDTTLGRFSSVDPWLVAFVLAVSLAAGSSLLLWAEWQRRRFTGVERRRRAPDVVLEERSEALGCDGDTARTLSDAKVVTLRMREDGSPEAAALVRIPRPRRPIDAADTPEAEPTTDATTADATTADATTADATTADAR